VKWNIRENSLCTEDSSPKKLARLLLQCKSLVFVQSYLEAALLAEEAGQTVHESVARQELSNTQQVEDPTKDALEAGNPGYRALHVADSGDGGQKMRQPHLGRNVQPVVMHGHEGRRAHGVADILEVGLAGDLQDLGDLGGYVVFGHLVPGEVPEYVVGRREEGMVSANEIKNSSYTVEAKLDNYVPFLGTTIHLCAVYVLFPA